jgi:hypothetical protein
MERIEDEESEYSENISELVMNELRKQIDFLCEESMRNEQYINDLLFQDFFQLLSGMTDENMRVTIDKMIAGTSSNIYQTLTGIMNFYYQEEEDENK